MILKKELIFALLDKYWKIKMSIKYMKIGKRLFIGQINAKIVQNSMNALENTDIEQLRIMELLQRFVCSEKWKRTGHRKFIV